MKSDQAVIHLSELLRWLNRYRRLLTRWEKKPDNYQGMLHFACGLIVWNKLLLG
ncbi:hypothetical protein YERSI8AC_10006 [Enterobacterales bacterium 8AC]|nr:hypothetical protein YERSI8AC_10006 [Enterobacterales bacterium 8AC]